MAVILHRFSTEISSSGLGRRPLTAETRVRVPVSLPNKAFSNFAGGFVFLFLSKHYIFLQRYRRWSLLAVVVPKM